MNSNESTCWTLIRGAAGGDASARETVARRYEPVIRRYLRARWGNGPLQHELDDAVQEVFVEFFRESGALSNVQPDRPGGFRAFLHGVVRNVALRIEARRARARESPPADADALNQVPHDETALSAVFDRAWAQSIMREAAARQAELADTDDARRRVELLRLRFGENLPIREIAARWRSDAAQVHREHAKARAEFRRALLDVLASYDPAPGARLEQECRNLLAMLD